MYGKGKSPRLAHEHKGFHGSPKETHKSHGGEVAGTRELTIGGGPGEAAMRIKPKEAKSNFEGGNLDKKMPKTGKPYSEE